MCGEVKNELQNLADNIPRWIKKKLVTYTE